LLGKPDNVPRSLRLALNCTPTKPAIGTRCTPSTRRAVSISRSATASTAPAPTKRRAF